MNVAPMIPPEVRRAVARLFDIARSDTGQARRVADFLMAWWNAGDLGGFDIADLFALDRAVAADMTTVFAFLGHHHSAIYADAFDLREDMKALIALWRPGIIAEENAELG